LSADIGRLALTTAAVVGGFLIGGPIGASIGLAIGAGLGFLIFPPEGKTIEGPRLDDLRVSFSSYGRPVPRLYGTMETGGNVIWSPGLVEHRTEEEVGGKGSPSVTQVTFLYTASFRINYVVGPAQAILKNWADGKLIRDNTGAGPASNFFGTEAPGDQAVRDFLGTTTQLPGPAEQADKGVANTPAYRGTVGQEWEDFPLEDFGNRIPQMTAEIAMVATDIFPSTTIDPSPAFATQGTIFGPNSGVVYVVGPGSQYHIVDLLGTRIVRTITLSNSFEIHGNSSLGTIDDSGVIWAWKPVGVQEAEFAKFTADTGELIVSSVSEVWANNDSVQAIILLQEGVGGAVAIGDFGRMIQLSPTLVKVRDHNDTFPFEVNSFFAASYSSISEINWAVDSNGDPWFTISDATDGYLIRMDRADGTPVERFTLSGREDLGLLTYDPLTDSLIVREGDPFLTSYDLIKFDLTTKTVTATLAMTNVAGGDNDAAWRVNSVGLMYLQEDTSGNIGIFDVTTMTRIGSLDPDDWVTSTWSGPVYDQLNHAILFKHKFSPFDYTWMFLDRKSGSSITVRFIVEDVSSLVGWTAGTDIDATELTDTLPGYIIRTRMTARKALEPLATAFNWRSVESDFKIKFPKRGGASVGNIPQIDLGATAGESPTTQPLKKTRIPEDQLFETAIIEYIDPTFDNNPNTQQAKRSKEAIDVGGSIKFDFPGALGNAQAAQIIERILFQAWSGRTSISTAIPLKHILKDPGDVVTITKDGKTVTVELHDVKLGANSIIKITGTIDDSVVHASTATGSDAEGEEGQTIVLTGPTDFFILDTSLLRDVDDGNGIYVGAGTPEGISWPGAAVYRGRNTTSINPFVGVVSSRNLDYGIATTVLATFSPDIWDRTNSLTVSLTSGALSSDTEINVLNGANPLLVGDEIIQFVTAVLNADGTYTVSTLLRGRRGTEGFSGTHVINERVVVLSASTVLRVDVDLSDHLITFFYKALTLGSSQFSSKTIQQVLNLRSQMPYAPSHVKGTRPANDWLFTLIRRTRVGGAWRDFVDVPLSEGSENYEWDVMDGATVKRTLTSVVESVTYTEAQQITDFGSVRSSVELNVHQLSDTVGRGFVTNVTIGL